MSSDQPADPTRARDASPGLELVQARLDAVLARIRLLRVSAGLARIAWQAAVAAVALYALDRWLALPRGVRIALLVLFAALLVRALLRRVARPLFPRAGPAGRGAAGRARAAGVRRATGLGAAVARRAGGLAGAQGGGRGGGGLRAAGPARSSGRAGRRCSKPGARAARPSCSWSWCCSRTRNSPSSPAAGRCTTTPLAARGAARVEAAGAPARRTSWRRTAR